MLSLFHNLKLQSKFILKLKYILKQATKHEKTQVIKNQTKKHSSKVILKGFWMVLIKLLKSQQIDGTSHA